MSDDLEQAKLFEEALRPTNFRTEYDDRYAAALLDGIPRGVLQLVSGKAAALNLAEEADAVLELLDKEYSLKEIAKMAGVHVSRVEQAVAFTKLPTLLQEGIREGAIARNVARRLVKLGEDEIGELEQRYFGNGTVTAKDVREVQHVAVSEQAALLPDSLFPKEAPANDVETLVRGLAAKASPDEIREWFEDAMDLVFAEVVR